jgi:hypothetical protein
MSMGRGKILDGVTILFLVVTWIVVPLRIYTRTFIRKCFGLDDAFAVLAFVCWVDMATFDGTLI